MSISFLRQLLMKEAVKKYAGSSGIMTINRDITKEVDKLLQKYVNDALAQGVDIETLSPDQLKMIVAMNRPKTPKVLSNEEAYAFLNKAFPKKGEVIPFKQKRSFAEEIEAMKKSGDIVESGNLKKSDKALEREMFKEANERLSNKNQTDIVTETITKMTNMEPVTALKEANKVIKREGTYKNLTNEQSQKILKSTDDWIHQRDLSDRYDYKKNRPFRDDPDFDPDDPDYIQRMKDEDAPDFAKGGRAGYNDGMLVEPVVEIDFASAEDKAFDDMMKAFRYYIKSGGTKPLKDYMRMSVGRKRIGGGKEHFRGASGGRAGYYTGGIIDVEPNLSDIGHGSDALMARTRVMSPGSQATTSTGLNYLLAEDNDNIRVPFANGNGVYDEKKEKELLGKRVRELMDDGFDFGEAVKKAMKEGYAEGGRIGFASGTDLKKRAFLKLMAALTGGIAGIKSGILGFGGKETGKKAVTETVKQSVGSGTPPPYFFKLVEKIRALGDDTLASQDKTIAKKYKDYVMEEDFAGNITIVKKESLTDNPYPKDVYMNYKVDDAALKNKKGFAKAEEYEEFTTRPDMDGKMKDVDDGVPDEVIMEVEAGSGNVPESFYTGPNKIKKADGGRIGFRIGGSGKKFLEKIFGKEKFKEMATRDPEMYTGMLEVVDMFRKRDKEGLKMYLQKFLPHMDDETIEAFIIGSDGTEGIQGQLIRLGSGRDYKGKLEMMKKADNMRKLENLDVTEEMIRKPNASGGLTTMLGE